MGIVTARRGSIRFGDQELIARPSNAIARLGVAFCPEERGIFASLNVEENLLLPPRVAEGGLSTEAISRAVPEPQGAPAQPGHQALGRRAADAGHRPHPAHRGPPSPARRAHGGPGPGHRPADRPHHPPPQGGRIHHPARRAELPLRGHRGRPSLRDGARPRRGHDPQSQLSRPAWTSCTTISECSAPQTTSAKGVVGMSSHALIALSQLWPWRPGPPSPRSPTASSRSVSSTTSRACTPTWPDRARWWPPAWRWRISRPPRRA